MTGDSWVCLEGDLCSGRFFGVSFTIRMTRIQADSFSVKGSMEQDEKLDHRRLYALLWGVLCSVAEEKRPGELRKASPRRASPRRQVSLCTVSLIDFFGTLLTTISTSFEQMVSTKNGWKQTISSFTNVYNYQF